jgi:hypothetical protein
MNQRRRKKRESESSATLHGSDMTERVLPEVAKKLRECEQKEAVRRLNPCPLAATIPGSTQTGANRLGRGIEALTTSYGKLSRISSTPPIRLPGV